jgi:hypothetical protein
MTSIYKTHLGWVKKLMERGETILPPKYCEPMGIIKGYIKTQYPHTDTGCIFQDKNGMFGLFGDFRSSHTTGIEWGDLGLCDARCWYEWMDPETYQPKTEELNVYGQRLCNENCPAYYKSDKYGEMCNARLDRIGSHGVVDGKVVYGMVCKLPVEFRVVKHE